MTRVLLCAATTGYQIRSFGEAADACGVRLVFATDRCDQLDDPWWDDAVPVRFHDEESSLDALQRTFRGEPPAGVLAVGDRPALLAARAASAFQLSGHPPAAVRRCRNKLESRRTLAGAGLPAPEFRLLPLNGAPSIWGTGAVEPWTPGALPFPLVVKPLAMSGSRGVMRVDDDRQLCDAIGRLRALLASADVKAERDPAHDAALIESFVPGREFAVEGVMTHGALRVLAIFDKPDPLDGPFFEETIYVTPSRADERAQQGIRRAVASAAHALGLWHGPIHAECRVNTRGVFVLEVAARPIGGLCSRSLRFTDGSRTDISLEEVLLRHALGQNISSVEREPMSSGVMMIPIPQRGVYRGVQGIDAARAVAHVDDIRITAKPDALLVPLPEGRSYLGFIFAHGTTPAEVEYALREAHGRLRFRIDRDVRMVR